MLNLDSQWRYDSPGEVPREAHFAIANLVGKIASQAENRKSILEHFKSHFAKASGSSSSYSTNESWAESDLDRYMAEAACNEPLFIEAFYNACVEIPDYWPAIALPDLGKVNALLSEKGANYTIQPPNLVSRDPKVTIIVNERAISIDEQARALIQKSFGDSDVLLSEGRIRLAVQETLWLLETFSTAFQGIETQNGTIEGKYFNTIADNLKKHHQGTTFEQVLTWIKTLHGYLSSPTGGGVRHGAKLSEGFIMSDNEARLFCNLIKSYITFLIAEHDRLRKL